MGRIREKPGADSAGTPSLAIDGLCRPIDLVVVEVPQIYDPRSQKGDQADLIELAGVDGALVAYLDATSVKGYLPREWKGQVPKAVMNKRIEGRLTPAEIAAIDPDCPLSLLHNVLDSIGIGLYEIGRLSRRIV